MTLLFVTLPPMLVSRFDLPLARHWTLYVPTMLAAVVITLPVLRSSSSARSMASRSTSYNFV